MIALLEHWHCLDCNATGTGPHADQEATKHTKTTGHSTIARATPKEPTP